MHRLTALYSVYRSQRFDDLVAQAAVVQTLKNAVVSGRVAHAYLFTGIRGTGKTSTARILAKAVNCLDPKDGEPCNQCSACVAVTEGSATDLIEIDAASNRGIDEIRDLREKAKYLPALLRYKVYIIDEAHQLTPEAFNALLKTLEEPPPHVLFVLCTTEAHKMPATIVSRCQRFEFRRISETDIVARLEHIAGSESLKFDSGGLKLIASMAQGSLRDAISMLDQLASAGVEVVDEERARRQLGLATGAELAGILAASGRGDAALALRELDRLAGQGADLRQLTNSLAETARKAVQLALGAASAPELGLDRGAEEALQPLIAPGPRFAAAAFEQCVLAGAELRQSSEPRLVLELLLLRLAGSVQAGVQRGQTQAPSARPGPAPAAAASPARSVEPAPETGSAAAGARAQEAPARPSGSGAVAQVQSIWPSMLASLRARARPAATRLQGLLADAWPVEIEGDLLTVAFPYGFHRDRVEEPAHRQELEEALAQACGRSLHLRFVVDPTLGTPRRRPAGDPEAGARASTQATSADRPGGEGTADPAAVSPAAAGPSPGSSGEALVNAAMQIFDARVTDVRSKRAQ